MGHEERVPLQVKDKRDPRAGQGEEQLRAHGSCATPENLFPPPRVVSEYPPEGPHTSSLPQSQGVENRERDAAPRSSSRHVKVESGGGHRGSASSGGGAQPLAPVNPNCSNENNIDITGGESGGQVGGAKGNGGGANRGQASQMRNQGASAGESPHQKSPPQGHMSSFCCKPNTATGAGRRLFFLRSQDSGPLPESASPRRRSTPQPLEFTLGVSLVIVVSTTRDEEPPRAAAAASCASSSGLTLHQEEQPSPAPGVPAAAGERTMCRCQKNSR
ncbi:hypothetical protein EYF80_063576 [Liparis tanakae]|uniref:Uncharacterized protein n=1 Tax=Liparis tanakae TaxID=230148 RepID=A0A4Z2EBM5_9TELE|nr:hypothetical protein EYF80_063576 [Liparis tanakae]